MTTPQDPFAPPPYGPPPGEGGPYQQGPYQQGPYSGWQPAPQTDGKAIAVLVLAICSFVVFPVIPAIVALVLAPGASRDIAASGGRLTGESLVRAGRIVAWINLVLVIGTILAFLLIFGFLGVVLSAATSG